MKHSPRIGISMGNMGDIGIGEISRLFMVISINNRSEWVSYPVSGISNDMIYCIGILDVLEQKELFQLRRE